MLEGGTKERFEGKFNLNSFKGARQFSAIGMGNNTNAEGFSFMDILNFTGEMARMQKGGGGDININVTNDDPLGLSLGGNRNNGIRTAWGGGLNYNNIIGNKLDLQSNYFYNRLNPKIESEISREYFLPDSSYFFLQHGKANNLNDVHRLNLNLLIQLDSLSSLRIVPSFSHQSTSNQFNNDYQTQTAERDLANDGFSNTNNRSQGYNFRNDIIYRKKFKRRGRTFSFTLQTSLNHSKGDGSLFSINQFYDGTGARIKGDTIDQQNTIKNDLRGYNARMVYTEPVWKKTLLEFSLGHSNTKSKADKNTFDLNSASQKYEDLNELLSNQYENNYNYSRAGFRIRTQKRNYSYSMGIGWQESDLNGKIFLQNGIKDSTIEKSFHQFLPTARFQYNFTRFKSFTLNYGATTNQPSIAQLQPVPDNSNPLNIVTGNPDLKEEYIHQLSGNLNIVNPYKNKTLFLFFNMQATKNKIVNSDVIDQFGVQTTKPVNVNGVLDLNSDFSYGFPFRLLKANVEVTGNFSYLKGRQFINGIANKIRTISFAPGLRVDLSPTDKFNVGVNGNLRFNHSGYSLRPDMDVDYLSQEFGSYIEWELPKKMFFGTDFNYTINSQRAAGFNSKVPAWNASISKQVLKFNRGEIKLRAVDILNSNVGINRSTNQNFVEDSRYITLRRFFLLSFTYSLSKTGLNSAGPGQIRLIGR